MLRAHRDTRGGWLTMGLAIALTAFVWPRPVHAWWFSQPDSYTKTRYPIVLAHGMAGFDKLFGVYEYWYGIPAALRSGGAQVYVTEVSPLASTEARGEQLLAQVELVVAMSGAARVNLIGHSHGGLDARYVAAVRPDLVASVTTVGTPHQGVELATFLRDHLAAGSPAESWASFFADEMATVLGLLAGHGRPNDALAAVESLTADAMRVFNAKYPQGLPRRPCGNGPARVNGVRYYSWSGTGIITNLFDVGDYALAASSLFYSEPNDGLVGRCSSHLGQVIRDDYRLNHIDEVNQLFGLTPIFEANPTSLFRMHANRLKGAGL